MLTFRLKGIGDLITRGRDNADGRRKSWGVGGRNEAH